MSRSPFMPPSRRRSREAARRRRRRQRRRAAIGVALAVLAAALVYAALGHGVTLLNPGKSSAAARPPKPGAARSGAAHAGAARPATRLSAIGLPLGQPPLPLNLSNPRADPVRLSFPEPPRAGIMIDLDSGRVLWQRNALTRLRIASLTKLMTALLTVKSTPPDARVLITKQAEETSGSKVGVLPLGRRVPLKPLLYGLLLPSGNDAAVALAQHVAGTVHRFVGEMNAQAARLGLGCTRYSSPSGFYNTHNYSCAADLAELAHIDLQQPRIAQVTRTYYVILPFPIRGGKLYLYNNNPLLIYGYPGTTGMKTGETIEAGRCLVATAERHGVRLAVVLLHSPAPGNQARELLDDAFQSVYHQRPVPEPQMPPGA
jgi:D-alanyl-D-alanine carboxypeptidase (penicillin-binding protein 5/6)